MGELAHPPIVIEGGSIKPLETVVLEKMQHALKESERAYNRGKETVLSILPPVSY